MPIAWQFGEKKENVDEIGPQVVGMLGIETRRRVVQLGHYSRQKKAWEHTVANNGFIEY